MPTHTESERSKKRKARMTGERGASKAEMHRSIFSRDKADKSGPSRKGSGLSRRKETAIERRKRTGQQMSRVKGPRKPTGIERRKTTGAGGFKKVQ